MLSRISIVTILVLLASPAVQAQPQAPPTAKPEDIQVSSPRQEKRMNPNRTLARNLAAESISRGKPLEWFETLYCQARDNESMIPWADMKVNPNLATWLERACGQGTTGRALVIGCGLGDDAEALQSVGFQVTAFDISETCIAWCRRRFPGSAVDYVTADLFAPPAAWYRAFGFVFEAYTLQVLPEDLRPSAMRQIAAFVAADGRLLVITRGRDACDDPGKMPWPLVRGELDEFAKVGLTAMYFEDYLDSEDPPVRRFRVEYRFLNGVHAPGPAGRSP